MTLDDLRGVRGLIYAASPYTSYIWGRSSAAYDATRHAEHLMSEGFEVFSPVSYFHHIARVSKVDETAHDFWLQRCRPFMDAAVALVVVKLPGWEISRGIAEEAAYFQAAGKPVVEMEPLP